MNTIIDLIREYEIGKICNPILPILPLFEGLGILLLYLLLFLFKSSGFYVF